MILNGVMAVMLRYSSEFRIFVANYVKLGVGIHLGLKLKVVWQTSGCALWYSQDNIEIEENLIDLRPFTGYTCSTKTGPRAVFLRQLSAL